MDWRLSVARADERERQAAESARYRLGIAQGDRVDVFAAIVKAGIRLVRYPLGTDGLLGAYKRLPGEAFILINSSQMPVRQRFTAAHELGHHFLGIGGTEEAHFDTDGSPESASDRPADWFAGYFLMDEQGVVREATDETPVRAALRVANQFGVSIQAAAIQLAAYGLITPPEQSFVNAERQRHATLPAFYRAEGLPAPKAQHADEKIVFDPTYLERSDRYVELGIVPPARVDSVRSLSQGPSAG